MERNAVDDRVPSSDSIRLSDAALESLRQESLRAFPEEGCGFLVGPRGSDRVTQTRPRPNVFPGPRERRFVIDGLDYVRLEDELDDSPLALLGIFHSHPLHPPVPSEHDRSTAWPGLAYFIQEVRGRQTLGDLRAWRLDGQDARFEPLDYGVDGA